MNKEELLEYYRGLVSKFTIQLEKEKRRLLTLSFLRLIVFLCGTGITVAGFAEGIYWGIAAIVVSLALFLLLVYLFTVHSSRRDFYLNLVAINNNEIKGLYGDYSSFNDGREWIDKDHDFSNDVDLFGRESLFQYLDRTVTGYGREILAGWFSDPFKLSTEIRPRQDAIKELSGILEWRQGFIASAYDQSLSRKDIAGLLEWLRESSSALSSTFKKVAIFLFPALTILSLLMVASGFWPYTVFIAFFLFNLLLALLGLGKTAKIHAMVSKKYLFLSTLVQLISSIEKTSFKSSILSDIKFMLADGPASALKKIRQLSRIIHSFDTRLNLLVGIAANGLLLWDFHCIRSLEKWKRESADLFPEWMELLGQTDAYLSLANFAFNNQGYSYPEVTEDSSILEAKEMGHPLLGEEKRICNDVSIEGVGSIYIITGANMAGKSTFLRTVAVNLILAMSGAPVCARSMRFRPLQLFTSMRTTDSLSQNESYFYAELKRLRNLKNRLESGEEIFFILDEILKGTNSADKSTGSKLFLKKIIDLGGTGMIATHDISLGEMENEFPGIVINKCFEIEIDGETISFDYKLRDGITKRMNAALLLKQMGIAW